VGLSTYFTIFRLTTSSNVSNHWFIELARILQHRFAEVISGDANYKERKKPCGDMTNGFARPLRERQRW
jgi:hypothetical protein